MLSNLSERLVGSFIAAVCVGASESSNPEGIPCQQHDTRFCLLCIYPPSAFRSAVWPVFPFHASKVVRLWLYKGVVIVVWFYLAVFHPFMALFSFGGSVAAVGEGSRSTLQDGVSYLLMGLIGATHTQYGRNMGDSLKLITIPFCQMTTRSLSAIEDKTKHVKGDSIVEYAEVLCARIRARFESKFLWSKCDFHYLNNANVNSW
jgi:hypothetical protein